MIELLLSVTVITTVVSLLAVVAAYVGTTLALRRFFPEGMDGVGR